MAGDIKRNGFRIRMRFAPACYSRQIFAGVGLTARQVGADDADFHGALGTAIVGALRHIEATDFE